MVFVFENLKKDDKKKNEGDKGVWMKRGGGGEGIAESSKSPRTQKTRFCSSSVIIMINVTMY